MKASKTDELLNDYATAFSWWFYLKPAQRIHYKRAKKISSNIQSVLNLFKQVNPKLTKRHLHKRDELIKEFRLKN